MTKFTYYLTAVALLALGACSNGNKSNAYTKENMIEAPAIQVEDFVGTYIDPDDGSKFEISKGSNDEINVVIDLIRLTLIDDGVGQISGNELTFKATDASGNLLKGKITLDGDTATLVFTDSTWAYLPNGTTFRFVRSAPDIM